jgi:hypothetical protein
LVWGIGSKTCSEYLGERDRSSFAFSGAAFNRYGDWTHGYLSGSPEQPNAEVTHLTIIAFLDNYCRGKPLMRVFQGVDCLREEAMRKQKSKSCQ